MNSLHNVMKNSHENNYIGENVSQLEHSILAAQEAENEYPIDVELIVASFLHDIGHQPICIESNFAMINNDGKILGVQNHETVGANYLKKLGFSDRVCNLVGNHVKAKRYLAYINSYYLDNLSDASAQTFVLQGGSMTKNEANEFGQSKYFEDSLLVRKYDELAKDASKLKKPLWELFDRYIELSESLMHI